MPPFFIRKFLLYMSFNTQSQKVLLETVLDKIHSLSSDIHTVFLINPEERFQSSRHTYVKKELLELLVILEEDVQADHFYQTWIANRELLKDQQGDYFSSVSLQVVSVDEFVREIEDLESYRERLLSGRVLYDRDLYRCRLSTIS